MQEGTFKHISTATTTLVKTGAGVLHNIVINTTSAGAITVYDGIDNTGAVIGIIAASAPVGSNFKYGVGFKTGLTIVTAGASDITVSRD